MSKPFAWSYSALTSFEQCPHRFLKTRISKEVTEPQSDAMLWGNRVHKALEDSVKKNTPLPEGMTQWTPIIEKIKEKGRKPSRKLEAEQKLAVTKDMRATTFFGSGVYIRAIIDVTIEDGKHAFVGDYKTGNINPDSHQLMLTAGCIFATRPWIESITNTFIWLKDGSTTVEKFTREDEPQIWQEFLPRAKRMEDMIAAREFPKRPSGLCRKHCPVRTCEHNGFYGEK